MHPAPSIILFTTASGAGYGLLFLLALGAPFGLIPSQRGLGATGLALALGLITLGLLASTAHLGHPERAWRAVSQWRSSWLSREGAWRSSPTCRRSRWPSAGWHWAAPAADSRSAACSPRSARALTVWCTGMIYASLKPVRQWHQPLVAPLYLAFALMSGALLLHLLLAWFGLPRCAVGALALVASLLAFALKTVYWRRVDAAVPASTPESATGLGAEGLVRMIEPPHTQTNYLLSEMGFVIGRRHARKLRRLAYAFGLVAAALLTLLALATSGLPAGVLAALAALAGIAGIALERWLFFAEATHTAMLYYGRRAHTPQSADC